MNDGLTDPEYPELYPELARRIAGNIAVLKGRVDEAARASGRDPSSVQLVVASKYGDVDELQAVLDAGIGALGENRVQALEEKAGALRERGYHPEWHFIGNLQKNKVRKVVPLVELIHSVDSQTLAEEIDRRAAQHGKIQRILIEVNVLGEVTKKGCAPEIVPQLLETCVRLSNIRVDGFMCMAPFGGGADARRCFRGLRLLRDRINEASIAHVTDLSLGVLSMGMSGDFQVAIEEGSSMVRIGSAVFE